jgi:hypothetical protein
MAFPMALIPILRASVDYSALVRQLEYVSTCGRPQSTGGQTRADTWAALDRWVRAQSKVPAFEMEPKRAGRR